LRDPEAHRTFGQGGRRRARVPGTRRAVSSRKGRPRAFSLRKKAVRAAGVFAASPDISSPIGPARSCQERTLWIKDLTLGMRTNRLLKTEFLAHSGKSLRRLGFVASHGRNWETL